MTGYGRGAAERDGHRALIEIRAVNHRFMDVKLRGANLDPSIEEKLQSRIRDKVNRGSLTVTVRVDSPTPSGSVRVDVGAARRVHTMLRELADTLHLEREISLSLICNQPGVLVSADTSDDRSSEELASCVFEAADRALSDLVAMRENEGATLARDISQRLAALGALAERLSELAKVAPEEAQRRLSDRLNRLLSSSKISVDDARLAQEVAILADRLDVTEELVRVRSHVDQVGELLGVSKKAIGRRLDFLVQELGREFNTIASKSQSADIASTVVEAKAELEKVREQVQNIE